MTRAILVLSLFASVACGHARTTYSAPWVPEPSRYVPMPNCSEVKPGTPCCECLDTTNEKAVRHLLGYGSGECMQTHCSPKETSR